MSNLPNFPTIRPSLLLDFANSKQVDPRIAVTRASTATYFDAQGVLRTAASGVPRIDHDPVTGECKGLLIEEARTNLLLYSEQFDNAAWTKTATSVTANTATAPDGSTTMDALIESTATGVHSASQTVTIAAGSTLTASVFVKPAPGAARHLRIQVTSDAGANGFRAFFDLSAGSVATQAQAFGTGTAVANSATVQTLPGGLYRVSVSGAVAASATNASLANYVQDTATGSASYTGDGTSGLYIWGAQIEAGAFPTSYVPTTTAAATRAADAASMSGVNFSEWYRQDEGTFVAESATNSTNGATSSSVLSAFASSSNYQRMRHLAGLVDITAVSGGALVVDSGGVAVSVGTFCKTAMAYKSDDYVQYTNGVSGGTDTSAALPVGVAALNIGSTDGAGTFLNGHIKRIAYYPKRLTGAELQALTA